MIAGTVAGLGAAIIGWLIAWWKDSDLDRQAEEVYREECLSFGTNADWCAAGVIWAKEMLTPFWAEAPIVTGLVAGAIVFIVVLIAVWSMQSR